MELLQKVNELYDACVNKSKELEEREIGIKTKEAQLISIKESLTVYDSELSKREDAVKKIEDILKISQETKLIAQETADNIKELNIQRNAFIATQDRVTKEFADRGKLLADKESLLNFKEEELAKKEANLEAKITAEVKKILGK